MSITKGFEERRVDVPTEEWSEHGTFKYWGDDVEYLLKRARALEAMLKKHEWADKDFGLESNESIYTVSKCPECGAEKPAIAPAKHEPYCQLAKLLEGVE